MAFTTAQLRELLTPLGLSADTLDDIISAHQETLDEAAWEDKSTIKWMRRQVALLDNLKVKIAQVECAMKRGQINDTEAVERIIVIKQEVEKEF